MELWSLKAGREDPAISKNVDLILWITIIFVRNAPPPQTPRTLLGSPSLRVDPQSKQWAISLESQKLYSTIQSTKVWYIFGPLSRLYTKIAILKEFLVLKLIMSRGMADYYFDCHCDQRQLRAKSWQLKTTIGGQRRIIQNSPSSYRYTNGYGET